MHAIKLQADPLLDRVVEEWLAHLILAMPVLPNNGIIFNRKGSKFTVVNRRQEDSWTVSFRDGSGQGDLRHYSSPVAASKAVLDGKHNKDGQ